ncbi:MAG: DUF1501 domain-containing protein [Planctomycetota bacterium]|nr:MAG: DUF1501 domain-containing protein [Planctomycetota bacterium]REJ93870.1 MAG: DUF1501 domain-containing protein [Planctomycetota bacterium]REK26717.1 MAG: DUF1501 domain-containing protein [Planctomycetota bacterium]REK35622.1 MAG: DUF1501 domain-containing protein [Planctomycetota bacterium]
MSGMNSRFCDGISRRGVVQAGMTGLFSIPLSQILAQRSATADAGTPPDTAVIFLELAGGPTQHETYDPKPLAPAEYRGPLGTVPTGVTGVHFSEMMQQQARIMDKLVILRAMHHNSGSHGTSSHLAQTGYYLRDRQNRDNEMPCIGSITARVRGANRPGLPAFAALPSSMRYGRSAWLGKGFNPFSPGKSANAKNFQVPNLTLLDGVSHARLADRRALLAGFDDARRIADRHGIAESTDEFARQAFDMVTGDAARDAFDITAESDAVRDNYGRNSLGQDVLLARRLVEAGVTFVSVRCSTLGSWDDHGKIEKQMKRKGPGYDQAVAALINDLHDRGLAEKVMVIAMGEFGRTPRINRNAGRDHWGRVMSVLMAGGGLPAGQVIGSSDPTGSHPLERPYRPEHVLAMAYRHLGIDAELTFTDPAGRPRYVLERRELIEELA